MGDFMKTTWILVGTAVVAMLVAGLIIYDINTYNTAYALGTEVETTEEYTTMFGDSFSGRILSPPSYWERAIIVRNADGVERVFAARWLEPVEATTHPNT